jgi:ammonia channel protein AmtB
MTPAAGFFYGGLGRRKNLIPAIFQTMTIFAVVSLVWLLWGCSEALHLPNPNHHSSQWQLGPQEHGCT